MALFTDLHGVAQVLAEHIREELGLVDVQPGQPRDVEATVTAAARITLLYTTPQPGHQNDPPERAPDGGRVPPPLTLTCVYLVTTSGHAEHDPVAAHTTLGRILTLYHDQASLDLPLSATPGAPPGVFSEIGEGALGVVQVPMTLDQIDNVWTSVEPSLQPWALLEVAPVALAPLRAPAPGAPPVLPGGVRLAPLRISQRPAVLRVVPSPVRAGGRVQVEVAAPAEVEGVRVGAVEVARGDPELVVASGEPLVLSLTSAELAGLGEGIHPLSVRAGGLFSPRDAIRLAAAAAAVIDAPATRRHDPTTGLVLTGANLQSATQALVWPDEGVASPADVHTLTLTGVAAGQVTVPSAGAGGLAALPRRPGAWRLAVRVAAQHFTPYIVVDLRP